MVSPTIVVLGGQKVSKFKSLLLLFGSLILLSGCSNVEVLNPKGPMASDSKFLIIYSIIFMLVIIAAVLIMFAVFLFKYRIGNTSESGKMHHNSLLETIWFIVPVIIVIALAIPTVKSLYEYENHRLKKMTHLLFTLRVLVINGSLVTLKKNRNS